MRTTTTFLPALLAALLVSVPAAAKQCPARPSWPTAAWPDQTAQTAAERPDAVKALEDYAFTLTGTDQDRKGIRTDGVVIVRGGAIVYEKYARGFTPTRRHIAWSVTKSITAALAGALVSRGLVSVQDSVCKHVPGLPEDNCGITLDHLLEFGSGIDWREIYEDASNQESSVLAMLYGEGHADMGRFVGLHHRRDAPGTSFQYSTGEATLLAAALGNAAKPSLGEEWPWKLLFDPLGMKSVIFERDAAGTFVGGSYVFVTPRDLARFGWMFLNDGCWEGQRLLPEGWVETASTPSEVLKKKSVEREDGDVQGRCFWLNRAVPEIQQQQPMKDVPADAVMALGHWGQSCTMIPSLDLVVVRMGDDRDTGILDRNEFLERAIAVGVAK